MGVGGKGENVWAGVTSVEQEYHNFGQNVFPKSSQQEYHNFGIQAFPEIFPQGTYHTFGAMLEKVTCRVLTKVRMSANRNLRAF